MKRKVRSQPPKKQKGQGFGPRTIDGAILDIRCGSLFLGWSEKTTRAKINRGEIPSRRLSGRIILVKAELEEWIAGLPGLTLTEVRQNLAQREKGRR